MLHLKRYQLKYYYSTTVGIFLSVTHFTFFTWLGELRYFSDHIPKGQQKSKTNFPAKTSSILISSQDRKTNSLVCFLEEVLGGKFAFKIYWPLISMIV